MNYEETVELEKNVKIKNKADSIYKRFISNCKVCISDFDFANHRFEIWRDSSNATYLYLDKNCFIFQCRFLHETYNVNIIPCHLFEYIKDNYRGMAHFVSYIETLESKAALEKIKEIE